MPLSACILGRTETVFRLQADRIKGGRWICILVCNGAYSLEVFQRHLDKSRERPVFFLLLLREFQLYVVPACEGLRLTWYVYCHALVLYLDPKEEAHAMRGE